MPQSCCVRYCTNTQERSDSVTFFPFPTDPVMANIWRIAVERSTVGTPTTYPTTDLYVCSDHFKNTDFVSGACQNGLLKPKAVPSVFIIVTSNFRTRYSPPLQRKKVFFDFPVTAKSSTTQVIPSRTNDTAVLHQQKSATGSSSSSVDNRAPPPDSPAQNCTDKVNVVDMALIGHRISDLCGMIETAKKRIEKLKVCIEITDNFNRA